MNADEINAVIAQTQGWLRNGTSWVSTDGDGFVYRSVECPDYTRDWNELYAVVNRLTSEQVITFLRHLRSKDAVSAEGIILLQSTQLEVCEAIIKTLAPEKWKE